MSNLPRGMRVYLFWCLGVICFILGILLVTRWVGERTWPGSTIYGYPQFFLKDFYQYTYLVRVGQQGKFLYEDVFRYDDVSAIVLEPHYAIVGLISKPFTSSPFEAYALARLLSLGMLMVGIIVLIEHFFVQTRSKLLALGLFSTATSFWWIHKGEWSWVYWEPTTYSNFFNILLKYTAIPPHHYLAVLLVIVSFYYILANRHKWYWYGFGVMLGIVFGFVHPYIAGYTTILISIFSIWEHIRTRKLHTPLLLRTGALTVPIVLIALYYRHLLLYQWKSYQAIHGTFIWSQPTDPIWFFFAAIGPVLILAIPALLMKKTYTYAIRRFVVLWAITPLFIHVLGYLGLPTSTVRLSQLFLQIPFSLLAALSLELLSGSRRWQYIMTVGVLVCAFAYALIPGYFTGKDISNPGNSFFYNYYTLDASKRVLAFLATTPKHSVVMAGEMLSVMIPSFTDNKVIIGHEGTNPEYGLKKTEVVTFFYGTMPEDEVRVLLNRYQVSYIVFGADSIAFDQTQYMNFPFFKVVYSENNVTVVQIVDE